jgi:hypothetical protein
MVFNIYNPDGSKAFSIESTDAIRSEESTELSLESLYESVESSYTECTKYINAVEVMSAEGFGENAKAVVDKVVKNIKEFLSKVCNFIIGIIQKCAAFFKNEWNKLTGTDKLLEGVKHLGEINDETKRITLSPLMYKLLFEPVTVSHLISFTNGSARLNSECDEIYSTISKDLKSIIDIARKPEYRVDDIQRIAIRQRRLSDFIEQTLEKMAAEITFTRQLFLNDDYVNGDNHNISINELVKRLRVLTIDVSSVEKNIETSNKVLTTYSAECSKLLSQISADMTNILSSDKRPDYPINKERMDYVRKTIMVTARTVQVLSKTINDELVYSTKLLNEIRKCCSQISKYNETKNN